MEFNPGDICSFIDGEGLYGVLKILEIVKAPGRDPIFNVAVYQELFFDDPTENDLEQLHTFIGHFPISEKYFLSSEPRLILRRNVSVGELSGFRQWFNLWKKGKAGIFDVPIAECIKSISQSLLENKTYLH